MGKYWAAMLGECCWIKDQHVNMLLKEISSILGWPLLLLMIHGYSAWCHVWWYAWICKRMTHSFIDHHTRQSNYGTAWGMNSISTKACRYLDCWYKVCLWIPAAFCFSLSYNDPSSSPNSSAMHYHESIPSKLLSSRAQTTHILVIICFSLK